jgi:biopolymer transport protein TolQ
MASPLFKTEMARLQSQQTISRWIRVALMLCVVALLAVACEPVTSGNAKAWLGVDIIAIIKSSDPVGKGCIILCFLFSIASWAVIIFKGMQLSTANRQTRRFLKECMAGSGDLEEAYRRASAYPNSPLAQILREGYLELEIEDWYKSGYDISEEQRVEVAKSGIERVLERTVSNEIVTLESNIIFLALTSNVAPFFGLFGTVWGIMGTFQALGTSGAATLSTLAPGIATALTTVVAGLAAAIPSSIFFNYFTGKVQNMISRMDSFTLELSNIMQKQLLKREVKA